MTSSGTDKQSADSRLENTLTFQTYEVAGSNFGSMSHAVFMFTAPTNIRVLGIHVNAVPMTDWLICWFDHLSTFDSFNSTSMQIEIMEETLESVKLLSGS